MVLRPRFLLPVLVALAGLLALPGCSDSGPVLTVYSGRNEDLIAPLLTQFAEETGIDVEVRYGDSTDFALQISEEGDRSPADVFISQSPGAVSYLDDQDMLAAIEPSVLALADEQYRASDGHWVGLSGRRRVLVYNQDEVGEADLPDSVLDLTDPAYAGQVGLAPTNASFQDFVSAMRADIGDEATLEWLQGMADNDSPTYENNTAIVEAVGRGEIPLGLVNHYYNERALTDDPDLPSRNHYFPADDLGSLVLVTAASIVSTTDVSDEANQLIEFLLAEDAQRYFTEETFEYPLAAGVEAAHDLPPLEGMSVLEVDDDLGGDLERTIELIDESGLSG